MAALNSITLYWLSNKFMTVGARVQNDKIVDTPPVIKKFRGQPFVNLIRWMEDMDPTGFYMEKC